MSFSQELAREPQSCYTHYSFSVHNEDFKMITNKIQNSCVPIFKENTSPGQSLYFLDPDGYKLEIHAGNIEARMTAKRANPGNSKNVESFV